MATSSGSTTGQQEAEHYHVAFIGSGLTSTFTLIRLLEKLLEPAGETLHQRVLVVEQDDEFFTGIPYGHRSGSTALIITPLDEFLPEAQMAEFHQWMAEADDSLFDDFVERGGPRSKEWLERTQPHRSSGDWSRVHLPRYFWGRYITERVGGLINQAAAAGVATVDTLHGEVLDVLAKDPGYALTVAGHSKIDADRVMLGIGMPPTRQIFGSIQTESLTIEKMYEPDLDTTVDRIADAVDGKDEPTVVIVGANAGALEILYQLDNVDRIRATNPQIHVLSPQGRLPERFHKKDNPAFGPSHLEALDQALTITANDILKAVKLDVQDARAAGFEIGDSLPTISTAVGQLLERLDHSEMQNFVAHPGVEIGQIQRRAGDEYCDSAQDLDDAGALTVHASRFVGHQVGFDGKSVVVHNDGEADHELGAIDVLINCSGSAGLQVPNQSCLLTRLLESGLCQPTESGHGIAVDDNFQSAPNFFVNGPLLAGNVVRGQGIWHVEHCGRIISFSGQLAELLAD